MSHLRTTRRSVLRAGGAIAGLSALGALGARTAPVGAQATPVAGGSLIATLNVGDISGFTTWQASTAADSAAWSAVYDTLVEYDTEYNIVGSIFESWSSDDATTWTFKVRQGVTWHDGVPLVAQDVIDYFDALTAPDAGAGTEVIEPFAGATYEAPDDATVVLMLAAPNAALLDKFSAHWLLRARDFDPAKPIGTGPFSFVDWERNLQVKYAKNANYWKPGLPYLDELTLRMVPDQDQALNLLTTGEVDAIASVDFAKVQSLSSNTNVQMIEIPEPYQLAFHYLLTKTDTAPWDNPLVRRAMNLAVDREAMLAATLGYGTIRSNPVSTGSWAFNLDAPSYNARDLDTAKQVMAEAGYTEGETAFKTTLKYWREWAQMPTIAQIVQANLADIGIEVELQLLEIGQWVDAVQNKLDYEMALTALVPRWDPSDQLGNAYVTDDGAALLWDNADFATSFAQGAATADQDQRQPAYFECQQIALTECPGTVLNGAPIFAAAGANIQGLVLHNRAFLVYDEAWIAP
jgi:peptide/nickel transport system substrate-binding protein